MMTSRQEASAPPPYTEFTNVCDEDQSHIPTGAPIPNEPPPKYEPPNQGSYPDTSYQTNLLGYQAVTSQPQIILINQRFAEVPVNMQCCHCFKNITTTLEYQSGALTWLTAGLLCLFGCWPCCPIPFCMTDLMDVRHVCPQCNMVLGTYRRLN